MIGVWGIFFGSNRLWSGVVCKSDLGGRYGGEGPFCLGVRCSFPCLQAPIRMPLPVWPFICALRLWKCSREHARAWCAGTDKSGHAPAHTRPREPTACTQALARRAREHAPTHTPSRTSTRPPARLCPHAHAPCGTRCAGCAAS
jgi:hypothetical protein